MAKQTKHDDSLVLELCASQSAIGQSEEMQCILGQLCVCPVSSCCILRNSHVGLSAETQWSGLATKATRLGLGKDLSVCVMELARLLIKSS